MCGGDYTFGFKIGFLNFIKHKKYIIIRDISDDDMLDIIKYLYEQDNNIFKPEYKYITTDNKYYLSEMSNNEEIKLRLITKKLILGQKITCVYCDKKISGRDITLDHYIPKSKGGDNSFNNLFLACDKCNNFKNGMMGLNFIFKLQKLKGSK